MSIKAHILMHFRVTKEIIDRHNFMKLSFPYSWLILFMVVSVSYSCKSSKKVNEQSEYSSNQFMNMKDMYSAITVNYRLDKEGINDTFNTIIDEYLSADLDFVDYDFEINVQKTDDAVLEFEGKKVLVHLPLDIKVLKETFLTDFSANGSLKMTFTSDLEIDSLWNLTTQSELNDYYWTKEPVLNFGLISLPIEKLANSVIEKSKEEIAKDIDYSIRDQFNLRNQMLDMLKIVEDPFQIDTVFNMFIHFMPTEVNMSRVWNTEKHTEGQILFKLNTQVSPKEPEVIPGIKLPEFNWNNKIDSLSTIRLQVQLDHDEIQHILEENLLDQTFEADDKYIKINSIQLGGHKDKIQIVANTSGSFNGDLVFRAKPYFNNETKEIEVEDLDIKVKTKNVLHKAASWLFKSKIKKTIEREMRFSVEENIQIAQENIDTYLKEVNEEGKVNLDVDLGDTRIQELLVSDTQIFLGLEMDLKIEALIIDFFELQSMSDDWPSINGN